MKNETKLPLAIWWAIWACLLIGLFLINHFIGNVGVAVSQRTESVAWMLGLIPVAMSTVIRWAVLPRLDTVAAALPVFVIGLALAEATCYLGIFLFPTHRQELFVTSIVGIFQFIPFFATSYFSSSEDESMD